MASKKLKDKILNFIAGSEGSMMSMVLGRTKLKKTRRKKQKTMDDLPIPIKPEDILFFDEDIK